MTIIEREIAKRQEIIDAKAQKEQEIVDHEVAIAVLKDEVASIDVVTLEAEIEELKSYLPVVETDVETEDASSDVES